MGKLIDLTGKRYGQMVVKGIGHKGKRGWHWICLCDCGREFVACGGDIRAGDTSSCGCYKIKRTKELITSHGMSKTRPYRTWANMGDRIYNPNNEFYKDYGGRGIGRDPSWDDFSNFWEDMKGSYSDELTLDRVDPNKGYSKENCRWATNVEQARNHTKQSNNKTGVTGICVTEGSYVFQSVNAEGRRIKKRFSIRSHGEQEAFSLAVQFKEEFLTKQKEEGLGYSDYHGCSKA